MSNLYSIEIVRPGIPLMRFIYIKMYFNGKIYSFSVYYFKFIYFHIFFSQCFVAIFLTLLNKLYYF